MILALKTILSVLDKQVVHVATNMRPVHVLPNVYLWFHLSTFEISRIFYIRFFCSILHSCIVNNRNKSMYQNFLVFLKLKIKIWTGLLKVSKFQNEFLKASFLPKYDFINSFWNLLTFIIIHFSASFYLRGHSQTMFTRGGG